MNRETCSSMVDTTYYSSEDLINKIQLLNGKTKLKFHQNLNKFFDAMHMRRQSNTFEFEEDPFIKKVESIDKIYHEVLSLMKFIQTKPQVETMKMNYYGLYYTVIKNRDDKKIVKNKYEDNEID